MKQGFTLVELSIVLVIIGLLIGGILVAQSMIQTAKIQAQIRQLQMFDVAVTNFSTLYKGIPGDNSKISVPVTSGTSPNDNGILSYDGSTTPDGASFLRGEINSFFPTLVAVGFLKPTDLTFRITANTDRQDPDSIWPGSPFNSAIIANSNPRGELFWEIYLPPGQAFFGMSGISGPFSSAEALAIDTKIDDGKGNSGDVAVPIYNIGGYYPWPGTPAYDTEYSMRVETENYDWCLKANSGVYNPTYPGHSCGLNIKSKAVLQ